MVYLLLQKLAESPAAIVLTIIVLVLGAAEECSREVRKNAKRNSGR